MSAHILQIENLSVLLSHKTLFTNFNTSVYSHERIAIIGRNGSGKTTLMKTLLGLHEPAEGKISWLKRITLGYVPQTQESEDNLSGGQKFQKNLNQELQKQPMVLCLDEPTNHLDADKRRALLKKIQRFPGVVIFISHDREALNVCADKLWIIQEEKIQIFKGSYEQYQNEHQVFLNNRLKEVETLKKQQKVLHTKVNLDRKRAAQSQKANSNLSDRFLRGKMRDSGSKTAGNAIKKVNALTTHILNARKEIFIPEIVQPRFDIETDRSYTDRVLISISDGKCGWENVDFIQDIFFQLTAKGRFALEGANSSGKSTFFKALLNHPRILKEGIWHLPQPSDIGYLDQHYSTLPFPLSPFEMVQNICPSFSKIEIRQRLNDFLFRKNEEVNTKISCLSGGEKARLSLLQIALKRPKLLLLDEMTNNLDLETRCYVIEVLNAYSGALLVISHDHHFLNEIHIKERYQIKNKENSHSSNVIEKVD